MSMDQLKRRTRQIWCGSKAGKVSIVSLAISVVGFIAFPFVGLFFHLRGEGFETGLSWGFFRVLLPALVFLFIANGTINMVVQEERKPHN